MFCVATAPAPARTQGHRLPTLILDVVIATPAIDVRSQTPTIEKVIAPSLLPLSGLAGQKMNHLDTAQGFTLSPPVIEQCESPHPQQSVGKNETAPLAALMRKHPLHDSPQSAFCDYDL